METVLFALAAAGYFAAGVAYLGYLAAHKDGWHKAGFGLFTAAAALHTLDVAVAFFQLGYLPADNLRSTLNFAAWALAVVYVFFQWRFRLRVLGAMVAPLLALVLLFSAGLPRGDVPPADLLRGFWVFAHIMAIFLGNGAFILAACVGMAYLVQERAIKEKRHGFFFRRLPSLEILDRMGYALVAFGFPMLTVGIAAGAVYAEMVWGRFWSWDPKEVWSLVTWLVYAALLHERLVAGWRGRRAAILAIVGLAVLLFTFFGVNFLLSGHHGQFTRM